MQRQFLPPDSDVRKISNQNPKSETYSRTELKPLKNPKIYNPKTKKFVRRKTP